MKDGFEDVGNLQQKRGRKVTGATKAPIGLRMCHKAGNKKQSQLTIHLSKELCKKANLRYKDHVDFGIRVTGQGAQGFIQVGDVDGRYT